jgi:hypothetical protein
LAPPPPQPGFYSGVPSGRFTMSRTIGFTAAALFDSAGRLRRDPALNAAHLIRIADVIVEAIFFWGSRWLA